MCRHGLWMGCVAGGLEAGTLAIWAACGKLLGPHRPPQTHLQAPAHHPPAQSVPPPPLPLAPRAPAPGRCPVASAAARTAARPANPVCRCHRLLAAAAAALPAAVRPAPRARHAATPLAAPPAPPLVPRPQPPALPGAPEGSAHAAEGLQAACGCCRHWKAGYGHGRGGAAASAVEAAAAAAVLAGWRVLPAACCMDTAPSCG